MKKYMLLTLAALMLSAPLAAWSQNASPATTGNAPQSQANQQGSQSFADKKAEILKHMNDRLDEQQKRIACVQAASDKDALHACMPKRGNWGNGGGMRHGMAPPSDGQGQDNNDMPPTDDNGGTAK